MSESLNISTSETAEFLREMYGSGIADVEQIGGGGWLVAFAFVHNGARNVIRWSDVADNFERDAVATHFSNAGLPIPPITEFGRGLNKFFATSPFIEGSFLEELSLVERCPEERYLVHSDLLNRNVLTNSGTINAVLDWGSTFYGDSLYDVAWFTFYEPWFPQFQDMHVAKRLLEDFEVDSRTNTADLNVRLMCYQLDIGIGSIAYNAFKKDWKNAQEAANYTLKLLRYWEGIQ